MQRKTLKDVLEDGKITEVIDKGDVNNLGLIMNDDKKLKRYMDAVKKKSILFDKEDQNGIDYTHMDFILSQPCGFFEGMTNLDSIKLFWKQFYPYLKNLAESYEALYDRYRFNIDDTEEVLAVHAETDFEIKLIREYLKEKGMTQELNTYVHNKKQEIINQNEGKEFKRASEVMPDLYEEGENNND